MQVRWVSRYFDQPSFVRALTNVNLEVYRGEVLGVLGPAASGKSTLIRILAGRLSPSEGRAKVFGRSPKGRAMRARVGYLPQNSNDTRSHLLSDVGDFLKEVFWLTWLGYRKSQPTPDPKGTDRRGKLRQILMKNPELVLLDEPFSGLDPAGCGEVLEFIHVLKQHGRTVVLSDNSLARTKDICDRLAVLRRGEIEAIGTLQDLLATRAGLHYVSELLSQATAERALNVIRQDLGVPHHPGQTSIETQNPNETVPTPDGVLLPLVKEAESDPAKPLSSVQSEPTVNHDMLAALTRNPTDSSRSRSEAAEKTTAKPGSGSGGE